MLVKFAQHKRLQKSNKYVAKVENESNIFFKLDNDKTKDMKSLYIFFNIIYIKTMFKVIMKIVLVNANLIRKSRLVFCCLKSKVAQRRTLSNYA